MVTEGKFFITPVIRYRLGVAMIWAGVLTWIPYILLRVIGQNTSPFWFLPFHLMGVVGGSRLRSNARKELGISSAKKNPFRSVGHIMIWVGVSVWVPYFYMKLVMHAPVAVMNYLPYHLTGVLGGVLMLGIGWWVDRKENR